MVGEEAPIIGAIEGNFSGPNAWREMTAVTIPTKHLYPSCQD
jgi:hypothetical protein